VAALGATNALWVDAASFLASAALLRMFVAAAREEPRERAGYFSDLAEGIRFVWGDRLIRAVVLTVLLTNFLDAPLATVLMPVYVDQEFGSVDRLGLIVGVFGAGTILGAVAFAAVGHRLPRRRTFVISFVLVSFPYMVLALTPSLAVTLAAVAFFGLAAAPLNPILGTVGYERIPTALRGRVLGTASAGAFSAIPLGMLAGGLLVEAIGLGPTLLAIGLCYLAVTSYGLINPAFREMDVRPPEATAEPARAR
jgi:MFS family permease